jgi:hypothetical protein
VRHNPIARPVGVGVGVRAKELPVRSARDRQMFRWRCVLEWELAAAHSPRRNVQARAAEANTG